MIPISGTPLSSAQVRTMRGAIPTEPVELRRLGSST